MARRTYARRYAEAVFQIALKNRDFESWQSNLSEIAAALSDETLARFLENPRFPVSEKERILAERFPDVNPLALNLLRLLVTHDNLRAMPDIPAEFEQLVDEHLGIVRAAVITAVPMDDQEKTRLAGDLGKLFGKRIKVTTEIDPSIIGGLIARVNGKLLDGSTRSRLLALKQKIAGVDSGES